MIRASIEKIELYGYVESIEIKEEIRAGKQAVLYVKLVLVDGSIVSIKEYIDAKYGIDRVSYGYQYHDSSGVTIFRYDNAKHKPALPYTEHKHLSNGDIVEEPCPNMDEFIDEVISML